MTGLADTIRARARLTAVIRDFFASRAVLEVATPVLSLCAVTDPAIASFALEDVPRRYLRTSPEFAMKRLLCHGAPDIFELGPVFRDGELGRNHNPEFILLEWYRRGFQMADLIAEVVELLAFCEVAGATDGAEVLTYREAFLKYLDVDIERVDDTTLGALALDTGLQSCDTLDRQDLLDLLFAARLQPALRHSDVAVITHYPKAQAALARLDDADPDYALRFEVFVRGIELANGFEELADAVEQRRRFVADNDRRQARGQPVIPVDERFLGALETGLPACSGVALGFERLLMITAGLDTIEQAMLCGWPEA